MQLINLVGFAALAGTAFAVPHDNFHDVKQTNVSYQHQQCLQSHFLRIHERLPIGNVVPPYNLFNTSDPAHNTNLIAYCNALLVASTQDLECHEISRMRALDRLVANATHLFNVTKGHLNESRALIATSQANQPRLQLLQSNLTLTTYCSVRHTEYQCHQLTNLAREQKLAHNQTWVALKFKNNVTRMAHFTTKVQEHVTKLAKLENNATLLAFCNAHLPAGSQPLEQKNFNGAPSLKAVGAPMSLAILFVLGFTLL